MHLVLSLSPFPSLSTVHLQGESGPIIGDSGSFAQSQQQQKPPQQQSFTKADADRAQISSSNQDIRSHHEQEQQEKQKQQQMQQPSSSSLSTRSAASKPGATDIPIETQEQIKQKQQKQHKEEATSAHHERRQPLTGAPEESSFSRDLSHEASSTSAFSSSPPSSQSKQAASRPEAAHPTEASLHTSSSGRRLHDPLVPQHQEHLPSSSHPSYQAPSHQPEAVKSRAWSPALMGMTGGAFGAPPAANLGEAVESGSYDRGSNRSPASSGRAAPATGSIPADTVHEREPRKSRSLTGSIDDSIGTEFGPITSSGSASANAGGASQGYAPASPPLGSRSVLSATNPPPMHARPQPSIGLGVSSVHEEPCSVAPGQHGATFQEQRARAQTARSPGMTTNEREQVRPDDVIGANIRASKKGSGGTSSPSSSSSSLAAKAEEDKPQPLSFGAKFKSALSSLVAWGEESERDSRMAVQTEHGMKVSGGDTDIQKKKDAKQGDKHKQGSEDQQNEKDKENNRQESQPKSSIGEHISQVAKNAKDAAGSVANNLTTKTAHAMDKETDAKDKKDTDMFGQALKTPLDDHLSAMRVRREKSAELASDQTSKDKDSYVIDVKKGLMEPVAGVPQVIPVPKDANKPPTYEGAIAAAAAAANDPSIIPRPDLILAKEKREAAKEKATDTSTPSSTDATTSRSDKTGEDRGNVADRLTKTAAVPSTGDEQPTDLQAKAVEAGDAIKKIREEDAKKGGDLRGTAQSAATDLKGIAQNIFGEIKGSVQKGVDEVAKKAETYGSQTLAHLHSGESGASAAPSSADSKAAQVAQQGRTALGALAGLMGTAAEWVHDKAEKVKEVAGSTAEEAKGTATQAAQDIKPGRDAKAMDKDSSLKNKASELGTKAKENVQAAGHRISEGASKASDAVKDTASRAKEGAADLGYKAKENIQAAGQKTSEGAQSAGHKISEGAQSAGHKISDTAQTAGHKISEGAQSAGHKTQETASAAKDSAKSVGATISEKASDAAEWVRDTASAAVEKVKGVLHEGKDSAKQAAQDIKPGRDAKAMDKDSGAPRKKILDTRGCGQHALHKNDNSTISGTHGSDDTSRSKTSGVADNIKAKASEAADWVKDKAGAAATKVKTALGAEEGSAKQAVEDLKPSRDAKAMGLPQTTKTSTTTTTSSSFTSYLYSSSIIPTVTPIEDDVTGVNRPKDRLHQWAKAKVDSVKERVSHMFPAAFLNNNKNADDDDNSTTTSSLPSSSDDSFFRRAFSMDKPIRVEVERKAPPVDDAQKVLVSVEYKDPRTGVSTGVPASPLVGAAKSTSSPPLQGRVVNGAQSPYYMPSDKMPSPLLSDVDTERRRALLTPEGKDYPEGPQAWAKWQRNSANAKLVNRSDTGATVVPAKSIVETRTLRGNPIEPYQEQHKDDEGFFRRTFRKAMKVFGSDDENQPPRLLTDAPGRDSRAWLNVKPKAGDVVVESESKAQPQERTTLRSRLFGRREAPAASAAGAGASRGSSEGGSGSGLFHWPHLLRHKTPDEVARIMANRELPDLNKTEPARTGTGTPTVARVVPLTVEKKGTQTVTLKTPKMEPAMEPMIPDD